MVFETLKDMLRVVFYIRVYIHVFSIIFCLNKTFYICLTYRFQTHFFFFFFLFKMFMHMYTFELSSLFLNSYFCLYQGNQFSGYGWALVSDSVPLNYICEISLGDVPNIEVEQRDEGKCLKYVLGILR